MKIEEVIKRADKQLASCKNNLRSAQSKSGTPKSDINNLVKKIEFWEEIVKILRLHDSMYKEEN